MAARVTAPNARDRSGAQTAPWKLSCALFAAFAVTTGGLHVLFSTQFWWLVVMSVVAAVLGTAAIVRRFSRRRLIPTLASAGMLVAIVTLFFAPGAAILGVVPTVGTLADVGALLDSARTSVYSQAVPAAADSSIVFVLSLGIGALAVLADLVTTSLRFPALAGVPLAVILAIPAFTARDLTDPVFFALAAAAYLVVLLAGRMRRQPRLAAGIGATAIIGALLVPAALPTINDSVQAAGPGLSTGVNPVLSLGDDLRRVSNREVLQYTPSSGTPQYLRLVSLENFTGRDWAPTQQSVDTNNTVAAFARPPGLAGDVRTTAETTRISVGDLSSPWLPIPNSPTSISGVANDWFWEAGGYSVSSLSRTARGQNYQVDSLVIQPTPEQLLAAGTTRTPALDRYLALPPDLPKLISDRALSVVGAAATNYEKAIALQEYFRSPAFTYSVQAPVEGNYDGTGMDIIAAFLEVRAGYCIQFASAMAVMARSLGMPARVVVGFLPGKPQADGDSVRYTVTTNDLHSWPELYFDGIGWVQFEPTPGRGEPRAYADVTAAGVPAPTPPPAATTAPTPTPSVSVAPTTAPDRALGEGGTGTTGTTAPSSALPSIGLGVLALIALSLVPALMRVVQRRRLAVRLRRREASAIDAWIEVVATANDLRLPVVANETPRETSGRLGRSEPLSRLLGAVEQEGYAATTLTDTRGLAGDVHAVRAGLFREATLRNRILATLLPASLVSRTLVRLRRMGGVAG